jgi:hypothetical protein
MSAFASFYVVPAERLIDVVTAADDMVARPGNYGGPIAVRT